MPNTASPWWSATAKPWPAADVVVFAIKPQMVAGVLPELQGVIPAGAVVLSIMAGITIATLRDGLDHPAVVRAMPNTPAMIGAGISGWTAALAVSASQKALAQQVLESFGQAVYVDDEHYINHVTAISGSGRLRFPHPRSHDRCRCGDWLARWRNNWLNKTCSARCAMPSASPKHPAELRNDVTSPAGTTAAGLNAMEKAGLRSAISEGVRAAFERSIELGKPKH
jgi:pyrroline-5-carboxylate reductase